MKLIWKMSTSNSFSQILYRLFIVAISIEVVQVECRTGATLNPDLCRYVGAGLSNIFHQDDIDHCKCNLDRETLHCDVYKLEASLATEHLIDNFDSNLSLNSSKLKTFLRLFASTDHCNLHYDDGGRIGCCIFSKETDLNIKPSLQLGVVASLALDLPNEVPDPLKEDEFRKSITNLFPQEGTSSTPGHCFRAFSIVLHAPSMFKGIRKASEIDEREFILSIGNIENGLKNMVKLGGSGNGFHLTHDEKYFIKRTNQDEYENLMRILPNYFNYMRENLHSLLSRFFSFVEYKSYSFSSNYFITNNLFPSTLVNPQRFDLKGSTVHRKTSEKKLRTKKHITYLDIDFLEMYPEGFLIDPKLHHRLVQTLRKDVEFLLSQNCLDYSLLIGVVDATQEMMDSINPDNQNVIFAKTADGQDKLLFIGIIDILQPFSSIKKIESSLKSIIHDRSSITIIKPEAYAQRFEKFILERVFKAAA